MKMSKWGLSAMMGLMLATPSTVLAQNEAIEENEMFPNDDTETYEIHVVQEGDSLWKISQYYGVDFQELIDMNYQFENPDLIHPNDEVGIPNERIKAIVIGA